MYALAGIYSIPGNSMQKVAKQNVSQDSGVSKSTQSISFVINGTAEFGLTGSGAGAEETTSVLRPSITAREMERVIYIVLKTLL